MAQLLFPLLLVALLVPMFLSVRRQKREAANVSTMQESLKVGDRVVTTSGLYGTVVDLDETTVDLEIAEEVVTTWLRQAIREVRADEAETGVATEHENVEPADSESVSEAQAATNGANGAVVHEHRVEDTDAGTERVVEETVEDTSARLTKD
jgi:preprotein translocase subunit YajC